jgi:murein DD-endopeptidase MepM/ murein hydrolase activator NlpD
VRLPGLRLACAAAVAATLAPTPALAGPSGGAAAPPRAAGEGSRAGERETTTSARRGARAGDLALSRSTLYLYGRAAKIRFRIDSGLPVQTRLRVLRAADRALVATLDLGVRAPGAHEVAFTGTEAGVLPAGDYLLQLKGGRSRRAIELRFLHHRFPLPGSFDWGGQGSRFGAPRSGHMHQGQDLAAPEGTPVVAPRGGMIEAVQYQAHGAGHYVVLDGAEEDRDYVFMHLRDGSIRVREGQRVRTGQRIGDVGSTGRSTGPHLHFEIWVGGWYAGGSPIDPLPLLQEWAAEL